MNIYRLAEALGVDTSCRMTEIQTLGNEFGVGIDAARNIIIEQRIYQRIKSLVKLITEINQ